MSEPICDAEYIAECVRRATEYLRHIQGLRAKLLAAQLQLQDVRQSLEPGGVAYDGCGSNGSLDPDAKMVEGITRIEQLRETLGNDIMDYSRALCECKEALDAMPTHLYASILSMHYLSGKTWFQVSRTLAKAGIPYEESSLKDMRPRALLELYEVMPHEWRLPRHPAL